MHIVFATDEDTALTAGVVAEQRGAEDDVLRPVHLERCYLANALEKGDEVRIHGFGSFKTAQRAARMGRNPRTGEAVSVPARRVVRFAASTTLSGALKNTRAKRGGRRASA